MAEPISDMLMFFSLDGTAAIAAESQAKIDKKQDLNEGFTAGRYFEVSEFGFGIKLDPDEGQSNSSEQASRRGGDFSIWRSVKQEEAEPKTLPYRCVPETFSFTRIVDIATPILFGHCAKRQQFEKAVLIKRYRGSGKSGEAGPITLTFLRLTFSKVLLTSLDWSDGEVVQESGRFSFESVNVKFLRQNNDGSATGSPIEGGWNRAAEVRAQSR